MAITITSAMESTEAMLKSTNPEDIAKVRATFGKVNPYRVYSRTTSQTHVKGGSQFGLNASFETYEDAQAYVIEETNDAILESDMVFDTYLIRS